MSTRIEEILALSHELGLEARGLAMLGEGNTSARVGADSFVVKSSGKNLATLGPDGLTECRFDALLPLLEEKASPTPPSTTASSPPA